MKAVLPDGREAWIWYPDQCKVCRGYTFSDGSPCKKEELMKFISKIRNAEGKTQGIYGSLSFECDYFSVDEEKYKKFYNEQEGCCCKD